MHLVGILFNIVIADAWKHEPEKTHSPIVSKYFGVALYITFQTHYTLLFDISFSCTAYLRVLFRVTLTMWLRM
jgi:hypothetical protein